MITSIRTPRSQRGATLVVALILLGALTMIAIASVDAGVMSLRVARNVEEDMSAFQLAQSAIDAAIADPANLPTVGPLEAMTPVSLSGTPFAVDTTAGESLNAAAERTLDCGQPPRLANGTSLLAFSSFSYRVHADVDRTTTGRGRASLRQGQMLLGPKC